MVTAGFEGTNDTNQLVSKLEAKDRHRRVLDRKGPSHARMKKVPAVPAQKELLSYFLSGRKGRRTEDPSVFPVAALQGGAARSLPLKGNAAYCRVVPVSEEKKKTGL